jgi:hypothetical protein
MTHQRFTSVAAVALAAVLSAVFVAAAPVQAQGMVSADCRLASAALRDEASVGLAWRAGSLVGIAAQPAPLPADAGRPGATNAGKPTTDPALFRVARSSGA